MSPSLGKLFLVIGALFILIGCVFLLAPHIPFLGRLPGDIDYKGENVRFYFPIVTCIVLSILLTILLNIFGGWR
ncbi:MAG: DUF2905 domain-containing protein [Candidatus Omnitrophota bacterium]